MAGANGRRSETAVSDTHLFEQRNVRLPCGIVMPHVVTAYCTRGHLAADRGNVILVTHGYTGGPDMIDDKRDDPDSWGGLIGPGKAIDTDRYFVRSARSSRHRAADHRRPCHSIVRRSRPPQCQPRAAALRALAQQHRLFPSMLAPSFMAAMRDAGVDARFIEIDSDHGHFASSTDAAKWAEPLRAFLAEIDA